MTQDFYRQEFYVKGNLKEIFELIKLWFIHNKYKIKKEKQYSFLKANKGSIFYDSGSNVKRWLEIQLSSLPAGNFLTILGKNNGGSDIIIEEGKGLTTFLKTSFKPNSSAKEDEKYCIYCGAEIRVIAIFCDKCGKKQD
ncbi:MAG: hypothetical protein ACFFD2_04730 [Promethearchaeota archaeon]